MVAYSFKKFFVPQIVAGIKLQTVRADRQRHAQPGEPIQLYQSMRTKHCQKILPDDPTCTACEHIVIERTPGAILWIEINGCTLKADDVEQFAREDGFAPEHITPLAPHLDSHQAMTNMAMFWDLTHDSRGAFEGRLIRWK